MNKQRNSYITNYPFIITLLVFLVHQGDLSANCSVIDLFPEKRSFLKESSQDYDFMPYNLQKDKGLDSIPGQKQFTFTIGHLNQASIDSIGENLVLQFNQKGYLLAYIEDIYEENGNITVTLQTGKQFSYYLRSIQLRNQELPNFAGISAGEVYSFQEFERASAIILNHYENQGFPFTRLTKEEVTIKEQLVEITLLIDPGELILIDSIVITGTARLSDHFLENYLGIRPGMPFNNRALKALEGRLADLDFAILRGSPSISFAPGRATLYVPLDAEASSRFDGMVGLSGGGEQQVPVRLTGLLNFYLSNALAMGEFIDFSWQGPGNTTQILSIEAGYPYPFRIPLETTALFSLHKQDTSWLQLQFRPGLLFDISTLSKAGIYWHYTSNSLISARYQESSENTPLNLDFHLNLYGLEYQYRTRGYFRNLLQEGIAGKIDLSVGRRQINRNVNAPEEIYEGRKMRTTQVNISGKFEKRWQTGPRATLSAGTRFLYQSGENFPVNQLERFGGFRTLRGFDELSLSASSRAFSHVEFRFFTASDSYFNLFVNGGWYEQKLEANYFNDFPVGFGAGLNLRTNAGIFSIMAALGFTRDIPIAPSNAKIHVGYVTGF